MKTGRPTKPEGTTVHRNRPTHDPVVLPAEGRPGQAPDPILDLSPSAGRLWDRLWATPAATQWGDEDTAGLTRYVTLAVDLEVWADSKRVGELRTLEDRFGLNPYARRVSKWVHESDDSPAPAKPKARRRKTAMRVLDGGAAS